MSDSKGLLNDAPGSVDNDESRGAADRTVSSKEAMRGELREDMNKFLRQGGEIKRVAPNVRKDLPKKPVSNYASRPI
jgi:hypothetical protein